METILIVVVVVFLLGGGGWGYLVGVRSARLHKLRRECCVNLLLAAMSPRGE